MIKTQSLGLTSISSVMLFSFWNSKENSPASLVILRPSGPFRLLTTTGTPLRGICGSFVRMICPVNVVRTELEARSKEMSAVSAGAS